MEIVFADDGLRNDCNSHDLLVKSLGGALAKVLRQRLDELFNAETLEDMRSLPHISISPAGQEGSDFQLDLGPPYRLIFRPYSPSRHTNSGLDWKKIDSILILGIHA